jgi:tetratricopeptide (TPR) repeat protein
MGNVLLALGRFEEAITAYGEAINIAPKDSVPYYGLGNALRDSQRYEEAIIVYQQAIKLNPDFVAVYTNMNNVLSYLGRERMENLQKTQQ